MVKKILSEFKDETLDKVTDTVAVTKIEQSLDGKKYYQTQTNQKILLQFGIFSVHNCINNIFCIVCRCCSEDIVSCHADNT